MTVSRLASSRSSCVLNNSSAEGRFNFIVLPFAIPYHLPRKCSICLCCCTVFVIAVNAFSCGTGFCCLYRHWNDCLIHFKHSAIILPDTISCHTGKICPHIRKCQQNPVNFLYGIDLPLHFAYGFHKLCHSLCRKILSLHRNNHTISRSKCIDS